MARANASVSDATNDNASNVSEPVTVSVEREVHAKAYRFFTARDLESTSDEVEDIKVVSGTYLRLVGVASNGQVLVLDPKTDHEFLADTHPLDRAL